VIFVTVGTQLPFDRLIGAVDGWAASGAGREVFAQIGPTELRPANIEARPFMSPSECRELIQEADVVVAHAGMGTILSALELGTPVLIMPRQAALGEHRNDHQLATARWFEKDHNVTVAFDAAELVQKLDQIERLSAGTPISEYAGDGLIRALRSFIDGQPPDLADAA
jgi:exopolysaccharide biosynthesis glucuronosyltransferase PssE